MTRCALNPGFLMLMKKNWKMSTRVILKPTSMLRIGPITLLMNKKKFTTMI
jgi:hypothetical protein